MNNMSAPLKRSDRVSLYISAAIAIAAIAAGAAATVVRISEVAPGHDIPVVVPLADEQAELPLGPDGAAVTVDVETATVIVPEPAPATLFALWAQPIVQLLVIAAAMVIAAAFMVRLARGRAFERGTARLAYAGAGVITGGWLVETILTNMTTNGALSAISNYTYEAALFEVTLGPMIAVLVIAAVGVALQIGERLQSETEGLV
ncbi:hypothetical protein LGT39_10285 [Demequina sp. TTPB684]|uniref:hypothetical protein n=1 Tax=unclassified Demequina TaxID=2620311 RepID=UPI001CF33FD2|nr:MULTISPECIES: hypothetical protein [unclassified Demequina]MCB2413229.1 hypothetical protein [Demequina sp. TTPB684]UPU88196.1 hypothetical protein LGT36_013265 [Demequina sp. TMPB413]